jgi:flavin-dependent dehydrogenase
LVDATGRSGSPARHLAGHRIVYDRLVGLVGFVSGGKQSTDRRTLVEAVECGWWYLAPLPDGRQVGVFMTDADLLPAARVDRAGVWQDKLDESRHTRARIGEGTLVTSPRLVLAGSSRSPIVAGNGWVAVGDAAIAFDPLSSQGIAWAFESGLLAAAALDRHLRGDQQAQFARYLQERAYYYGIERRWPSSPFWQRRRTASASEHSPELATLGEKSGKPRKANHSHSYSH